MPQKSTEAEATAKQNSVSAPTQQSQQLFTILTDIKSHAWRWISFIFDFSAEKPEENQAPKPAKKKKARRETWDHYVCKRLPLRFMQHPFFFFFPCLPEELWLKFFCDWNRIFNSSPEDKMAFIHMKHLLMDLWILIVDTVQSFVKWRHWFSRVDLILLILSLTPLNLVTNCKSCIVEFRCRKYCSC